MDEHFQGPPPTGPSETPPRQPSIVLATSAPFPLRRSQPHATPETRGLRGLFTTALDGLDALADRVADAIGLR